MSESSRGATMDQIWTFPAFRDLPLDVKRVVEMNGKLTTASAGRSLATRGGKADYVHAIVSGVVKLCGVSIDGQTFILEYCTTGAWLGEISAMTDLPRIHDWVVVEDAVLFTLHAPIFRRLIDSQHAFCRAVAHLEAARLQALLMALECFSVESTEQRLAYRLMIFAKKHGRQEGSGVVIGLPLSQSELAASIGATRQRVNQALRDLSTRGVLQWQKGKVVILDKQKLWDTARRPAGL